MALVRLTRRTRIRMGYQRKNRNQLSEAFDIHIERGGSETNDISLIFFVMDIPPECIDKVYIMGPDERQFFPQRSDFGWSYGSHWSCDRCTEGLPTLVTARYSRAVKKYVFGGNRTAV